MVLRGCVSFSTVPWVSSAIHWSMKTPEVLSRAIQLS